MKEARSQACVAVAAFSFCAVVFLAAILTGCAEPQPAAGTGAVAPGPGDAIYVPTDPRGIRTAAAQLQPVPAELQLSGRIEPDPTHVVQIYPPVGGRVIRVAVLTGDAVRRGQELAVIESSDVTSLRADYQRALADAQFKDRQRARAADLFARGAIAERDFQQADADSRMADAEVARTLDRLKVLGVDPAGTSNQFPLRAPRDGVILDVGAAPGEFSRSLDAPRPLCTLADLGVVWAVGDVYEKDIAGIRVGQRAEVSANAFPGKTWTGKVGAMSGALDPVTLTLKLRVVLANPGRLLKPGMFASLRLVRSVAPALVLPATAVIREGAQAYVYVERGAGRFERRSVTLGPVRGQLVEVLSGVKAGEVVVTEGALLLRVSETP